jgi:hypothetical protein
MPLGHPADPTARQAEPRGSGIDRWRRRWRRSETELVVITAREAQGQRILTSECCQPFRQRQARGFDLDGAATSLCDMPRIGKQPV